MNYRKLGKTDISISEVAFGAWGIGGQTEGTTSYGPTDDRVSLKALNKAYDKGINFFDTANVYGYGKSEELIGKAFKDKRDKVIIATKAGCVKYDKPLDFSPQNIRSSIESSLLRLKTDYIDVLQLHNPRKELHNIEDTIAELEKIKSEGKIRCYGLSLSSPADYLSYSNISGIDSIQVNFNLLDQRLLEEKIINEIKKNEVSVLARTPLCFGFLTGNFSRLKKFHPSDHRSGWSKEQINKWICGAKLYEDFFNSIDLKNLSTQALRYCLSFNIVGSVITGMLYEDEVEKNINVSFLSSLKEIEKNEIRKIYQDNSFFTTKKSQKNTLKK